MKMVEASEKTYAALMKRLGGTAGDVEHRVRQAHKLGPPEIVRVHAEGDHRAVGGGEHHRGAGDVVGLVAYVETGDEKNTTAALVWARDFLGLRVMSRADREAMRRVSAQRQEQASKDEAALRARKLDEAGKLFRAAGSNSPIGPAHVPQGNFGWDTGPHAHPAQLHAEAYFAARQVPLRSIPTLNGMSLRFSPATEWWRGAVYRSEGQRRIRTADGPLYPAVHAAMRNALGNVTCCHCTFLDPLAPKKAPVEISKLMWGIAGGSVIELSCGPTNEPFWQADPAAEPQPVILTEGIETGLSFAVAGLPARVWACGSLDGIGKAPVHLPCISWVMFARDNNTGNAQAQRQFDTALAGLEAHGKTVQVEASHVGDDFNDLAKGEDE